VSTGRTPFVRTADTPAPRWSRSPGTIASHGDGYVAHTESRFPSELPGAAASRFNGDTSLHFNKLPKRLNWTGGGNQGFTPSWKRERNGGIAGVSERS
jgi:hypothetical protein